MIGEDNAPEETDKKRKLDAASISDFGRSLIREAGFFHSPSPRPECILPPLFCEEAHGKRKAEKYLGLHKYNSRV